MNETDYIRSVNKLVKCYSLRLFTIIRVGVPDMLYCGNAYLFAEFKKLSLSRLTINPTLLLTATQRLVLKKMCKFHIPYWIIVVNTSGQYLVFPDNRVDTTYKVEDLKTYTSAEVASLISDAVNKESSQ